MQTLAVDIASTFVDDATALVIGFGRAFLRFATGPLDRIANACDIAGVLTERRATIRVRRGQPRPAPPEGRPLSFLCPPPPLFRPPPPPPGAPPPPSRAGQSRPPPLS